MKLIPNEKIIIEHEDAILTNNSLIQEKETFFGGFSYTEIPINKITSISREHIYQKVFLFLFFIFFIVYKV